ncbi:MAG: hypothetical protein GXY86_05975 [Firmicutes bacterium]|nr:hypothetical protein [Bacillota bacterium]
MLTDQSKGIQKLIFERIYQIRDEILSPDPEYRELSLAAAELMDSLLDKLAPEDRELLEEYDSKQLDQTCRQDEILYSRGLMDGIVLCRWIERIGKGEEKSIV